MDFLVETLRLSVWLVLLGLLFGLLERGWALRHQTFFRKGFATDLAYYFLSGLSPKLLMILPMSLLAAVMHRLAPSPFYSWVAELPISVRLAAAMVVGEMGAYWGHRWSHEVQFLWRFHAVHHSSEEMDWLVSSRAHPVDKVFMRLCGLVPMFLLGLAQPLGDGLDLTPMIVSVVSNGWGFLIHSNVKWRLGWFEWVISSPAFHHWHHTNDGPEVINKNYAPMLPWVDWCFGTFYLPRHFPAKYGTDSVMPDGIGEQLLQPLVAGFSSEHAAMQPVQLPPQ